MAIETISRDALPFSVFRRNGSGFLESLAGESQGSAIFGHVAHKLLLGAIGKLGLNLQGDFDRRTHDAAQVLYHFLGDARCVSPEPNGVDADRSVKPSKCWRSRWRGRICAVPCLRGSLVGRAGSSVGRQLP